jgi:FkbM family methyltransferase
MRAARADVDNDLVSNGEKLVQTVALQSKVSPVTVFDVGANVGRWTDSLVESAHSLQVPVRVHAFEPCQETFAELSERIRTWPEVSLNNKACSRRVGTATMHVYGSGFGTNSLVEPLDAHNRMSEEVQLTTIDLYCETNSIGMIDLLKIDAEGHDFDVIFGASGMLDRKAVRYIQFEYNQRWIGSRNYLRDVFAFLSPKGYMIGKLTGSCVEFYPYWHWELENYTEGNYVACFSDEMMKFRPSEPRWLSFSSNGLSEPNE